MSGSLLLIALLAAVIVILVVLLIPVRVVRSISLAIAFGIAAYSVNLTATRALYLPSMIFAIVVLAIALLRTRSPRSGHLATQFTLAAWWVLVLGSVLVMHGMSVASILIYGTLALLASHIAFRLDHFSVRLFVRALLVLMLAEAILGAFEALGSAQPLWGYMGIVRENPLFNNSIDRAQGTFGHPIVYGWFMAVCAVLVWTNAAQLGRRWHLIALVVATSGLLFAGTRSAVLAAVAGIVLHIVTRPGVTRWVRNMLAAVGVVFIAALVGAGATVDRITTELLSSGSWLQRFGNISNVPALLGRPPMEFLFGQGWGRDVDLFLKGYLHSDYMLYVVDNMYVEALGTMGLIGLIAILVGLVVAFIRGDRAARALTLTVATMMFSFDTMVWLFTGIATMVLLSLPRLDKAKPQSADDEPAEGSSSQTMHAIAGAPLP